MRRSKKIYILLCILAITAIATYAVKQYEEHKEKIRNSEEIILQIPKDSVKSLSWEYKSEDKKESFAFHKDDKWVYDEDELFPVDEEKINDLLDLFEEFRASFEIEDVDDYGQYGLDDPICTINLTTDEKSYKILVGDYSIMDSQRYVSIGDGKVYLVKEDPMEHYEIVLSDLIDHDKTPIFNNNVTKIQFKGTENYNVVYEKDSNKSYNVDDVYFAKIDGKELPLDTTRVNSYLSRISQLNLKDYVTYKATDEDLIKYGLDKPELTVTIDYTTKKDNEEKTNTFVLKISRDPEEKNNIENKDEDSKDEKITAYVRVGDSKIIYKISSDKYKNLMDASYNSLRHTEAFYGDFDDIKQIDISLEGVTYTITSEEKDDKKIYYYKDKEIDTTDLRTALRNLKAESFTDERPTQKKEIGLKLYLDNEKFPEIKIELYRYDGTNCLAVIDGEPTSLIKRSKVVDLIESIHAIVLNK